MVRGCYLSAMETSFDSIPEVQLSEILNGGAVINVRVLQPAVDQRQPEYKSEPVKVRKVSKSKLQEYAQLNSGGDMLALAECLTSRPAEWLERVHDEDFARILDEGRRLNFTSLAGFYRQRTATIGLVEKFSQEVTAAVKQALESAGSTGNTQGQPTIATSSAKP